ncbi:MAG: hypothetical protein QM500_14140, partial [Methylococcales bacterium]
KLSSQGISFIDSTSSPELPQREIILFQLRNQRCIVPVGSGYINKTNTLTTIEAVLIRSSGLDNKIRLTISLFFYSPSFFNHKYLNNRYFLCFIKCTYSNQIWHYYNHNLTWKYGSIDLKQ